MSSKPINHEFWTVLLIVLCDACCSAATFVVPNADITIYMPQPMCRELPTAIFTHMAANPTSLVAHRFRLYARHVLVPSMQRISDIYEAHGSVVEMPSRAWLEERFQDMGWSTLPPNFFHEMWIAWTGAWRLLLAEWEQGDLSAVQPGGAAWNTHGGLKAVNDWSIARGEQRQQELIGTCLSHGTVMLAERCRARIDKFGAFGDAGMTAQTELPPDAWGNRV
eukprot:SAG31_NODE_1800_length_7238_cov_4.818602_10_plen_222_part_00